MNNIQVTLTPLELAYLAALTAHQRGEDDVRLIGKDMGTGVYKKLESASRDAGINRRDMTIEVKTTVTKSLLTGKTL